MAAEVSELPQVIKPSGPGNENCRRKKY